MQCFGWFIAGLAAWFFLWVFNSVVGGIWFRLRLSVNGICYYHGPKRESRRGMLYCFDCEDEWRDRRERKRAALEAKRKQKIGQYRSGQ